MIGGPSHPGPPVSCADPARPPLSRRPHASRPGHCRPMPCCRAAPCHAPPPRSSPLPPRVGRAPRNPLRCNPPPPFKTGTCRRRLSSLSPVPRFPLTSPMSCRSHLPRLRLEPQDRPAAHRSPLFPDAGHRLCTDTAALPPHVEPPLG
jgi:hypothetical protein